MHIIATFSHPNVLQVSKISTNFSDRFLIPFNVLNDQRAT